MAADNPKIALTDEQVTRGEFVDPTFRDFAVLQRLQHLESVVGVTPASALTASYVPPLRGVQRALFSDHFNASAVDTDIYTVAVTGSGAIAPLDAVGGFMRLSTGATDPSTTLLTTDYVPCLWSSRPRFWARVYYGAITDVYSQVGLADGTGGVDAALFTFDTATNANFNISTEGNSVGGTLVDTGIPVVQDQYYILEIEMEADRTVFKIDGAVVAVRVTELPTDTGGMGGYFACDNLAAANKTLHIDQWVAWNEDNDA